jgi:integrator complex subunit 4
MEPLLDQHTRRHRHFLLDTYPHLMPSKKGDEEDEEKKTNRSNTERFYRQSLTAVADSEHLSMANRITLLERAGVDLRRLGSIEPAMSDASLFASLYLQCQTLLLKCLAARFWSNAQESGVVEANLEVLGSFCLQLGHRFTNVSDRQRRKVQLLKIHVLALHLVFRVKASNKSALCATDRFLNEVADLATAYEDENGSERQSPFFAALLKRLTEADDHKPGAVVRMVQPLLLAHPLESLEHEDGGAGVALRKAVIYEPTGMNETPLKYTAGMVLAVPVDAEISNVQDCMDLVRLAIKTPDQKLQLVTPKSSHFFSAREGGAHIRLLTEALMSHQVWSEAMHVEISIVLDLAASLSSLSSTSSSSSASSKSLSKDHRHHIEKNIVHLCEPVKVYVLPKAVKRGI